MEDMLMPRGRPIHTKYVPQDTGPPPPNEKNDLYSTRERCSPRVKGGPRVFFWCFFFLFFFGLFVPPVQGSGVMTKLMEGPRKLVRTY